MQICYLYVFPRNKNSRASTTSALGENISSSTLKWGKHPSGDSQFKLCSHADEEVSTKENDAH